MIQKAIERDDAVTLKNYSEKQVKVLNSKEFVSKYPRVVTANWKKAGLRQKYSELFAN